MSQKRLVEFIAVNVVYVGLVEFVDDMNMELRD